MVCGEGDRRRKEPECKHFFKKNFTQENYKVICQTSDFAVSCTMTLKKHTHTHTHSIISRSYEASERSLNFSLPFKILCFSGARSYLPLKATP